MAADAIAEPATTSKSKKSKKRKSKANAAKANGETSKTNGDSQEPEQNEEGGGEEPDNASVTNDSSRRNSVVQHEDDDDERKAAATVNGVYEEGLKEEAGKPDNTEQRLEAASREREQLREEVTELRRSLESIQQKHDEELAGVSNQLEQSQSGKAQAESRYQKLLGQVNTIKTQLGERLKSDAVGQLICVQQVLGLTSM